MYCFDGIIYRLWGVCGFMFLVGFICILLECPWKKRFRLSKCKIGLLIIAVSFALGLHYASRIIVPDVQCFEGGFIHENRNSTIAPPLPLTMEYVFSNGNDPKHVFYLDVLSKKTIYPHEFMEGMRYRVYYDRVTSIIVMVEVLD